MVAMGNYILELMTWSLHPCVIVTHLLLLCFDKTHLSKRFSKHFTDFDAITCFGNLFLCLPPSDQRNLLSYYYGILVSSASSANYWINAIKVFTSRQHYTVYSYNWKLQSHLPDVFCSRVMSSSSSLICLCKVAWQIQEPILLPIVVLSP